jgi:hypothetical protein
MDMDMTTLDSKNQHSQSDETKLQIQPPPDQAIKGCPAFYAHAHAQIFAKDLENYDFKSNFIIEQHQSIGIDDGVYNKIRAIKDMFTKNGMSDYQTAFNLSTICNPAATGIWTADGKVNMDRLNAICRKSIPLEGAILNSDDDNNKYNNRILLRTGINEYLEELHGKTKNLGTAAHVNCYPVSWRLVTSKSFDELFTYCSDYKYTWTSEKFSENALTVNRFRKFYLNPKEFWADIVAEKRIELEKIKLQLRSQQQLKKSKSNNTLRDYCIVC